MKNTITCIGLATVMFAAMFANIAALRDVLDGDYNVVLTIALGTLYCMCIAGAALLGSILWILAFATGDTEETEEIEA